MMPQPQLLLLPAGSLTTRWTWSKQTRWGGRPCLECKPALPAPAMPSMTVTFRCCFGVDACSLPTQATLKPQQILRHIARKHNLYGQTAAERARVDEARPLQGGTVPRLAMFQRVMLCCACLAQPHLQTVVIFQHHLPLRRQVIEGADDLANQFFMKAALNKARRSVHMSH